MIDGEKPNAESFTSRPSCHTRLKAFDMSSDMGNVCQEVTGGSVTTERILMVAQQFVAFQVRYNDGSHYFRKERGEGR